MKTRQTFIGKRLSSAVGFAAPEGMRLILPAVGYSGLSDESNDSPPSFEGTKASPTCLHQKGN